MIVCCVLKISRWHPIPPIMLYLLAQVLPNLLPHLRLGSLTLGPRPTCQVLLPSFLIFKPCPILNPSPLLMVTHVLLLGKGWQLSPPLFLSPMFFMFPIFLSTFFLLVLLLKPYFALFNFFLTIVFFRTCRWDRGFLFPPQRHLSPLI